jgi:hypothetical protein
MQLKNWVFSSSQAVIGIKYAEVLQHGQIVHTGDRLQTPNGISPQ